MLSIAKGVFYLSLLLAGIFITIWRFSSRRFKKYSIENTFKKALNDFSYAETLIKSIDLPYKSFSYQRLSPLGLANILNFKMINNYEFIDSITINNSTLLYLKCVYSDFDTGLRGTPKDITVENHEFFVIKDDKQKKKITIYGEFYSSNVEKSLRTEFANQVLKSITK